MSSWKSRLRVIYRTTRQHAFNLAKFVSLYKILLLLQRKINGGKEHDIDTFIAGLIGGYIVFGERNAVNEQVYYIFHQKKSGSLKKNILDCALRRVSCSGFLHPSCNLAIQDFSRVSFGILCCKTHSAGLPLLYLICRSIVGRCHVAIPASRRNHPTGHVQLYEVPISRLGNVEEP